MSHPPMGYRLKIRKNQFVGRNPREAEEMHAQEYEVISVNGEMQSNPETLGEWLTQRGVEMADLVVVPV